MDPLNYLSRHLILPDLKLEFVRKATSKTYHFHCIKTTEWEICRRCPTKSSSVHDHRLVKIRDVKLFNKHIILYINKRRFRCPKCKAVFTEAVDGIKFGFRTTEKYRQDILYKFTRFKTVKEIGIDTRSSSTLVTTIVTQRLELELRKSRNTPWGKTVLIDEHGFKKNSKKFRKEMVTALVDNNRKCVRELAPSKNAVDLESTIQHIPGKENVSHVVIDMDDGFKNFALDYFINANIIVDKFHVLRLIQPAIRKYRKKATGDDRKNPIRHLLLKNRKKLLPYQKRAVSRFCKENTKVGEVYRFKERLSNFYNIKGYNQARRIFIKITDDMAKSKIKEIQKLRKTLLKWKNEILRYFKTGLTNARVEGFNRKCKLIQRNAYGLKNYNSYRLRVLYNCS